MKAPRRLALLAVLLAASTAFGCSKKRFKMPAGSMVPTFMPGSSLSADTENKSPVRGEVWVLRYPEKPDQDFVKRLVGMPGDTIEARGDVLLVNGKAIPSCLVGPHRYEENGKTHAGKLVMEKLDADAYLTFIDDTDEAHAAPAGPWKMLPGVHFAVGDNRKNSHDSRTWYGGKGGGVPKELLVGKVETPALALPKGAESLAGAFEKCKANLGAR